MKIILSLIFALCFSTVLTAAEPDWLELIEDPEERSLSVNEGELIFLPEKPEGYHHQHLNTIRITEASLSDGWVQLHQCHHNLDPVGALDIVYRRDRIRKLQILQQRNIGSSKVEDASVMLHDIQRSALICIKAETRALHRLEDGSFELRNGPYMRRFLDGYYPMYLRLEVQHPTSLTAVATVPTEQPGFAHRQAAGSITLEGWFEGKLSTRIRFKQAN
jgi:hypothetical protein